MIETAGGKILECGHPPSKHGEHDSGYGKDEKGHRYCYLCCAMRDREQMDKDGRTTLYLSGGENGKYSASNWPGSLKYSVRGYKEGAHNIARVRYDAWFTDHAGRDWHGVQYGDMTQILHCRRLK